MPPEKRAASLQAASKVLLAITAIFTAIGGPAEIYFRMSGEEIFRRAKTESSASRGILRSRGQLGVGGAGGRVANLTSECPSYRGEYDPDHIREYMQRSGWDPDSHSQVDRNCPRFLYAPQNGVAGIGHRFNQWLAALATARLMGPGVTFVSTPFQGGAGRHGNYDGWEQWLNLSGSEWTLPTVHDVFEPTLGKDKKLDEVTLSNLGGEYYKNEVMMRRWAGELGTNNCFRLMNMGTDKWLYDHSTSTKVTVAMRYHEQMESRGGREQALAVQQDRDLFDPVHVNIGVHVRVGDQYPTHETIHAGIIRSTIHPALRAAGVVGTMAIHVFAETADGFTALEALTDLASPQLRVTVDIHPDVSPLSTLYLLTVADFMTMSYSSFSYAAGHLAIRPLVFSPRSSDDFRMCTDTMVCCDESGTCGLDGNARAEATARRIAAQQKCGTWATSAPYHPTAFKSPVVQRAPEKKR